MAKTWESHKTKGVRLPFGIHRGELLTRTPSSYLRTLAGQRTDEWRELAALELKRRGTDLSQVEITGHAVDRASVRCLKFYLMTRRKREGIYSWLARVAADALTHGTKTPNGKTKFLGMVFMFQDGYAAPVLTTISPGSKHDRDKAGIMNGVNPRKIGIDDDGQ